MLVVLDIIFINLSSFLALWVRFNMSISEIPVEYGDWAEDMVIFNTIFTVLVFFVMHLYSSLWRFASVKELVSIIQGCLISVVANIIAYTFMFYPLYRS